ncbi:hypothetical protein QBC44DRAFT_354133 [Cladorrhinum sp. PSN332]|nr:hypothetical protein QBC44DRAFT_354133 [Cladorrhinum sp. PSN332]
MDHQQPQIQQPSGYYQQLQEEKGAPQPPQYPQQTFPSYHAEPNGPPPATTSSEAQSVPIKRSVALAILGALLLLLVLVIGLGAGLGVSQRNLSQANARLEVMQAQIAGIPAVSPNTQTLSTSTPIPAPSTLATSTLTASRTSTSTPSPTAALVQCPGVNNTIYTTYTSTGQQKRFTRLCGLDYSGEDEATDIANVKVNSLDQCIEACASRAGCTGAGWGVSSSDKADPLQSCWMKKGLKKSHDAKRGDWGFAVLLEADNGAE